MLPYIRESLASLQISRSVFLRKWKAFSERRTSYLGRQTLWESKGQPLRGWPATPSPNSLESALGILKRVMGKRDKGDHERKTNTGLWCEWRHRKHRSTTRQPVGENVRIYLNMKLIEMCSRFTIIKLLRNSKF